MLEPTKKKDTPRPKTKKKLQRDCRRGTIMIKSNPIPTRWVIHKLENNNTKKKKSYLTVVKVWKPMSGFPAWGPNKGTGNPQVIWSWSTVGFDHKTSTGIGETDTPSLEGTNKTLCAPRLRRKEQWLHRKLNQNHLLVLEGLLRRCGSAGAHHRDERTGSSCLGRSLLA